MPNEGEYVDEEDYEESDEDEGDIARALDWMDVTSGKLVKPMSWSWSHFHQNKRSYAECPQRADPVFVWKTLV
jgi:hypothetical protein